jgi:hypothetical protein
MKAFKALACGCLLAAAGCTSIRHYPTDRLPVGSPLPLEVSVRTKAGRHVEGTVFYRTGGMGRFEEAPMNYRAGILYAELPTDTLAPRDTVEYYVDVRLDGDLHAIGTPGSPYVVTMLDRRDMILSSLHEQVFASDTMNEVRVVLVARDQPIGQPTISYMMPGVPGEIRTPMEPDGYGNYVMAIEPHAVRSGTWKYAIEVPLDGSIHRMPRQGYQSFSVTESIRQQMSDSWWPVLDDPAIRPYR